MSSQVVKLKRTAVEGKVPSTNNIELGELAINTYDGRIFFEKDNGTPSIQQVVTTNSDTTGSLTIQGNVTASYFFGDGSGLTNLPNSDVSQVATVTSSFDNQSSIVIEHNFNSKNVFISVYDMNDSQIIPQSVILTNNNTATIGLSANHSGYVVVGKGGHIVSGTLLQEISEVATVTASFDNQSSINVSHNFNSRNVIVSVYDSSYSQLIPEILTLTDENSVDITLSGNHSGHVVVAKGGHFVSGSIITEADFTELTNVPNGLVSGSSQLTSSYDLRYALSGSVGGGSTDISSLNTFTSSIQTQVDGLSSQTSSYLTSVDYSDITSIPSGIVSGSSQLTSSFDLLYAPSASYLTSLNGAISSSIQILGGSNIFSSSEQLPSGIISGSSQVEFNSVNSTPFSQSATEVTTTKSIVPTTSTIDLGTAEKPFRDLYLSSASLYIDGQQVISSNASELVITTDNGQSIKLFEQGADDIILQTEDGNIELKGTVELQTGKKIIDSSGNQILFGNSLGITGSISLTGTVDGVNISQLKSDFDNIEGKSLISGSSQISYVGLSNIPSGIVSGSTQVSFNGINDKPTLVSGSSQIIDVLSSLNTYTSSNDTTNTTQNSRLTSLETKSGSVDSSISSINSFTSSNGNTALNDYTASLKTAISVDGQNVTVNGNFNVSGTQTVVDSTTVQIGDNIIELNGSGAANGGIQVKDATAPNLATGSLLWDSTNDLWKAGVKDLEVKILLANGDSVVSGSSQVSFSGIVDKPTLVSGSSQVISILSSLNSYTSSNDTTNTTQNSRLTSIESATGSYETKGSGIVSGSSQVSYTGLSSIPSGIVSGSSQITLSSTSGYGSVINQALLTTSSPTFAGGLFNGDVTSTSGYQGRYHRIYEASAQRGGMYTYNVISGGGTDYSIGLFSEGEFFIAPGGSATKKFTMSNSGATTFDSSVTANSLLSNTWVGAQGVRISSSPSVQGVYLGNSGTTTGDFATIEMVGGTSGGSEIDFTSPGFDRKGRIGYDNSSNYMWFETNDGTEKVRIESDGDVLPAGNGTQDLGSDTNRWGTVYTSDLSLNNGIGDWTIVEGEDDLFLYNNKKGKVYKFALTEVDPSVATPKKS